MASNIPDAVWDVILAQAFQRIIGGTNVEMNRLRGYELNISSEVLLTVREKAENNEPLTIREVELLEKMHKRIYTSLDTIKSVIADAETLAYEDLNKSKLKHKEKQ